MYTIYVKYKLFMSVENFSDQILIPEYDLRMFFKYAERDLWTRLWFICLLFTHISFDLKSKIKKPFDKNSYF